MRRRGGNDNPLSLFSFQDIITAVSGIMLLVVLLLVLQVLNVKSMAVPPPIPEVDAKKTEQDIRELRETVSKLNGRLVKADRDLKATSAVNLDQAPSQVRAEEKLTKGLVEAIDKVTVELSRKKQKAAVQATTAAARDELITELAAKAKSLKDRLDSKDAWSRVHYSFAKRTAKTPILAQCSAAGVEAKVLDGKSAPQSFIDPKRTNYQSSLKAFRAWARRRNFIRDAFVVLVKPSAAGYAGQVVRMLRQSGFDVGYEPLEEDRTAIFGDGQEP